MTELDVAPVPSDTPPFRPEQIAAWKRDGYIVLRAAVSPAAARATADAIWAFLGMSPHEPDSWYPAVPRPSIMVELYHHQALWNNRQAPRIHRAFAQLLGTDALWVSEDRCSMNPPNLPVETKLLGLHWDIDITQRPAGLGVQGLLYLTDTSAAQGAFQCVPGFHRHVDQWLKNLPRGGQHALQDLLPAPLRIAGNAGDMIIWNSALPHGPTRNESEHPRLAQYITMRPAEERGLAQRACRVRWWRERLTGQGRYERAREHYEGTTAQLSPLGRRLLGLERWSTPASRRAQMALRAGELVRGLRGRTAL